MSCPPPRGSLPTLKAGCATSAALDDAVAAVSWSAWMTTAARPDPVARRMSRGCDGYGGDAGKCRLIRSTDSRQVCGAKPCFRRAGVAPVSSAPPLPPSRGEGAASAPAWIPRGNISRRRCCPRSGVKFDKLGNLTKSHSECHHKLLARKLH